jgi:Protein of unknown function (DUF1488)
MLNVVCSRANGSCATDLEVGHVRTYLRSTTAPTGDIEVPLERIVTENHDFNAMIVRFKMLNGREIIKCAVSTAAMDDLEGSTGLRPHERVRQFQRLRDQIEECASRKFFAAQLEDDMTILVKSEDIHG